MNPAVVRAKHRKRRKEAFGVGFGELLSYYSRGLIKGG